MLQSLTSLQPIETSVSDSDAITSDTECHPAEQDDEEEQSEEQVEETEEQVEETEEETHIDINEEANQEVEFEISTYTDAPSTSASAEAKDDPSAPEAKGASPSGDLVVGQPGSESQYPCNLIFGIHSLYSLFRILLCIHPQFHACLWQQACQLSNQGNGG